MSLSISDIIEVSCAFVGVGLAVAAPVVLLAYGLRVFAASADLVQ